MSFADIPDKFLQEQGQELSGRLQFVCHVVRTALEMTNEELDQGNMQNYHYYKENKERYFDEFNIAKKILEEQIHEVMNNITNTIIEGVFQEE